MCYDALNSWNFDNFWPSTLSLRMIGFQFPNIRSQQVPNFLKYTLKEIIVFMNRAKLEAILHADKVFMTS